MEIARPHAPTIRDIIRRYYTVWGLYSFAGGFLFGVYPIFLRSRGLNQFQINSVLATYFVVLFLTDVPTGAFADLLGRRRSYVLGASLRVCAFLLYFMAHHYYVFLIAESIDGIGTTFGNGAIDAWGVDALDEAGYDGLKDRLFSRISQLTTLGFMGSAMIGAYVADIDIAWPWLLGAAGYLVSGTVGAFLMHDERPRTTTVRIAAIPRQVAANVGDGIRAGLGAHTVLMLSVASAVTFAAWAPYWIEWPVMFNESLAVGVWIVGWIYCGLSAARLVGAEVSARIQGDESKRAPRVSMLVIGASAMLFLAGLFGGQAAGFARDAVRDESVHWGDDAAGSELVQRADRSGQSGDAVVIQLHVPDDGWRDGIAACRANRGYGGDTVRMADRGADLGVRGAGVLGDAPARERSGRAGEPGEVIRITGDAPTSGAAGGPLKLIARVFSGRGVRAQSPTARGKWIFHESNGCRPTSSTRSENCASRRGEPART